MATREACEETWTIDPGLFSAISFLAKTWLRLMAGLTLMLITLVEENNESSLKHFVTWFSRPPTQMFVKNRGRLYAAI